MKKFEARFLSFHAGLVFLLAMVLTFCGALNVAAQNGAAQKPGPQGPPVVTPAVTDQTPLELPNTFGANTFSDLNQAGDYLFTPRGQSGLFLRRSGAASPVRILQMGDEVPGFPGTRADLVFTSMRINGAAQAVFAIDFSLPTAEIQRAILSSDGTKFTTVAFGGDIAPDSGGARYGRSLSLTGLNDSGDVAFVAPLELPGVFTNRTTLYIASAGGKPVRIIGQGDPAPGTLGSFGQIRAVSLNSQGEVLFRGEVVGGAGGAGLFVGSTAGVRKVVAHGDPHPVVGFFSFPSLFSVTGLLNNAGQTTFLYGGLYLHTPETGIAAVVRLASPAPPALGGIYIQIMAPAALDDSGEIAFLSVLRGSSVTNFGLFRYRPDNPVEVVAYRNQPAPGAPGRMFGTFGAVSMNSNGQVSFLSAFLGLPNQSGVYQQLGSDPPTLVALDGQSAPLPGGGTFALPFSFFVRTRTLDDGSTYFVSDVIGGTADYGDFLASGGDIRALMHTAETLPEGARVSLRTFKTGAAGDYAGFQAARAGGSRALFIHNVATGVTTRVVADGDSAPGTGGGRIRISTINTVFVNANGEVAFLAQAIGGVAHGGAGVFLWAPKTGVAKVVFQGDTDPSTGRQFYGIGLNILTPSPLNDAGQVVFRAFLTGAPFTEGLFVGSPDGPPRKIVLTGDPMPGGTFFRLAFLAQPAINSSAQVAFTATIRRGDQFDDGIFLGAPGAAPAKIVLQRDPGPGGSAFLRFSPSASLNDSGEVAFAAVLQGGPGGGFFVGTTSAVPQAVALNGQAAPEGGSFSGLGPRPDLLINNQHDLVFRADLVNGPSNSGYFIRRGPDGPLQTVALQGQPAPGTDGVFQFFPPSINVLLGEYFVLRPNGEVAFQGSFNAGDLTLGGFWRYRTDNTLEKIIARGDPAPGSGTGTLVGALTLGTTVLTGGRVSFWGGVAGGDFTDAIYVVEDPPLPETSPKRKP